MRLFAKSFGRLGRVAASWLFALLILFLRLTNRRRYINDPREQLKRVGRSYVYAGLHAHQVSGVVAGESGAAVMISKSNDGDLVIPSLMVRGIRVVRGSTREGDLTKGGQSALDQLVDHSTRGLPVALTVDGPRGPRSYVRRGVAVVAQQSKCVVLPITVVPSRRIILSRTWDRFQLPGPFGTITMAFGTPIVPDPNEGLSSLRARIRVAVDALELANDPHEAAIACRLSRAQANEEREANEAVLRAPTRL